MINSLAREINIKTLEVVRTANKSSVFICELLSYSKFKQC